MPIRPSQLKIMHLNVQSISNKLKEIQHHIATEEIDILSLNETWLKPSQKLKMP
jgi:exonuclease III